MRNKKGKTNYMGIIALMVVGALLIGGLGFAYLKYGVQRATIADEPTSGTAIATPQGCAYQPTVAIAGKDAITNAVATPTTINYFVNDNYRGTTAPAVKASDSWKVIGDLSGYLAAVGEVKVECGANTLQVRPKAYANATVVVKDDPRASSYTLTNGGGVNATAASAGSFLNLPHLFTGTTQKSTGNIFMTVETAAGMGVNTSSITASINGVALAPATIPNAIASANAGSARAAFIVPELEGSVTKQVDVVISNTATGVVSGEVTETFYAIQTFVDADDQIQDGKILDDSANGNNAVKYQDTYTYSFFIL